MVPMDHAELEFRQGQAAFDLIWALRAQDDGYLAELGGADFPRIVRGAPCRFENPSEAACYEALANIALASSQGAEIAVAMLLVNELGRGLWSGDAGDFALMAAVRLIEVPRPVRAAILRGVDALQVAAAGAARAETFLPEATRLTRSADQILPHLCKIARGMDAPTRETVAAADYGSDQDKHLSALTEVLAHETCLFPINQSWYPGEVVELVSQVRDSPGFVPCTALLLANALQSPGSSGLFEFRWSHLAAAYIDLPDSARPAILAGLRFLYEDGAEFLPYSKANTEDPAGQDFVGFIPMVDLPDTLA